MMDSHAGYKLMERLWQRGHRRCRWVEISNAGHQIFSENAEEFNFEMKRIVADERLRSATLATS
jgi:pimeloyl-ACP methyl ester carboxylesterase